jgi:ParB family chromosome partitioning protein
MAEQEQRQQQQQQKPSQSKPRLGRGLSSLISSLTGTEAQPQQYAADGPAHGAKATIPVADQGESSQVVRDVPIDQIAPNPFQPRREFPQDELANLAASIAKHGVLQPIRVTTATDATADKPYVVVAGERRLRAAKLAGLKAIPCVISPATQEQMLQWAVIENVQRSDLNPIERGEAYLQFINRFNVSQADLAQSLGEPRSTIANYLRILDLHEDIRSVIVSGTLSFGHAKVLAGLIGKAEAQISLARQAVAESLSVRQLEILVADANNEGIAVGSADRPLRARPAYIRDLEERLSAAAGTRVRVQPGRSKNTGRLLIEYYSLDDFERIAALLGVNPE